MPSLVPKFDETTADSFVPTSLVVPWEQLADVQRSEVGEVIGVDLVKTSFLRAGKQLTLLGLCSNIDNEQSKFSTKDLFIDRVILNDGSVHTPRVGFEVNDEHTLGFINQCLEIDGKSLYMTADVDFETCTCIVTSGGGDLTIVGYTLSTEDKPNTLCVDNANLSKVFVPKYFQYKQIHPETPKPVRGTPGSAGFDLHAMIDEPITINPGEKNVLIPTGFALEIGTDAVCAFIMPRSGAGHKKGLVIGNTIGLIDSDYQGQWFMSVRVQNGHDPVTIQPKEAIAQMLFLPVVHPENFGGFTYVDEFQSVSTRGEGGFGSTTKQA